MVSKIVEGFDLSMEGFERDNEKYLHPDPVFFDEDSEHESKRKAVHGKLTFTGMMEYTPVLRWVRSKRGYVPEAPIFRLNPDFFYKEYILANLGLDTVDANDMPEAKIRDAGYLLRLRVAIYAYLRRIGDPQATAKDLFSSSHRFEVENRGKKIATSVADLQREKAALLPQVVKDVDPERVRIGVAFLTARGASLTGVYLKDIGAIVALEASKDKTRTILPSFKKMIGRPGYESELEGKRIYLLQSSSGARERILNMGKDVVFDMAEQIADSYYNEKLPGHLIPQTESKLERAFRDCAEYYAEKGMNWSGDPVLDGLVLNMKLDHIEHTHFEYLLQHAKAMGSSYDLVDHGLADVRHVPFRPEPDQENAGQSSRRAAGGKLVAALR